MRYRIYFWLCVLIFSLGVSTMAQAQTCLEPRLEIGGYGEVTPGAANRVRDMASTSGALLGEIPAGMTFAVLQGPECVDGFLWWQVDYRGLIGWTVEANASAYFVNPVDATQPSATATQSAPTVCTTPTTLEIGRDGRITSSTPSRLRADFGVGGTQIGQIDALDRFTILEGPECADGIIWWRVRVLNTDIEGWTAEAVEGDYLLELIPILPTPTPTYIGLQSPVAIEWSADGAQIAVGTADGIYFFDAQAWDTPPTQRFAGVKIEDVEYSPVDANLMIYAQYHEEMFSAYLYDLESEQVVRELGFSRPVNPSNSFSFSADGTLIGYNSGGTIIVSETLTGELLAAESLPDWSNGELAYMGAQRLIISDDGLLVGAYDGRVRLITVGQSGFLEFDRETLETGITSLAFSPDSSHLIVGDTRGNLQMWNIATQVRTSFIRGERSNSSNYINQIVFHPDGAVVLTAEGSPQAVVRVFNAQSLQQVDVYSGGSNSYNARGLAFNPDASLLAVIVDDTIRILETETYTAIAELVLERR